MLRPVALLVSTMVRAAPGLAALSLLQPVGDLLLVLDAIWAGWLVGAAADRDGAAVGAAAALLALSTGVGWAAKLLMSAVHIALAERVGHALDRDVADCHAALSSLTDLDDPDFADQAQVLRQNRGLLGAAAGSLVFAASTVLSAAVALGLAAAIDPWLPLVAVTVLPGLLISRLRSGCARRAEDTSAAAGRRARHLLAASTDLRTGAEIRIYGAEPAMRARLADAVRAWRRPQLSASVAIAALTVLEALIFTAVLCVVLATAVRSVSTATTVAAVLMATAVWSQVVNATFQIGALADIVRTTGRLLWLRSFAAECAARAGTTSPPARLTAGIGIEDLTVDYVERPALSGVSARLPAGSIVAVVGENGAGKSTLAAALLGLRRAAAGRVSVDGVDLADMRPERWWRQCAAALQDVVPLELTVADYLGAGAVEVPITDLPDGRRTVLGASWPGGVGLSGGQWQQLVLARIAARRDPLLVVLDEPTASLDPDHERRVFERFAGLAGGSARAGGVTVLITHRLQSVAIVDLVLVLERGRVVQAGPPAELLAADGLFRELHEIQAAAYR